MPSLTLNHTICILLLIFLGQFAQSQGPGEFLTVNMAVVEEKPAKKRAESGKKQASSAKTKSPRSTRRVMGKAKAKPVKKAKLTKKTSKSGTKKKK